MSHTYNTVSKLDKRIGPVAFGAFALMLTSPTQVLAQEAPAANVAAPSETAPPPAVPVTANGEKSTKEVCGHIGIALPLLMMDHPTKNVGDEVNIAVPIGIGFKLSDKLVFDFETVVATHIKQGGKATGLTVDPGIVYDLGPFAAGIRVKWDIGAPPNIGVIPLIHRGIVDLGGATWFIEAAFPTTYVTKNVNFDVVLHTGLGF